MRIEHPHTLGQDAAVARIKEFVAHLLDNPLPGGVTVKDVVQQWTGGQADFSFKAAKGFFAGTVKGRAEVSEDTVALELDLPSIVTKFLGEDAIRHKIGDRIAALLR